MFYKYQAHSLIKLAKIFSEITGKDSDPLKPIWIVAQNNEIKEWLSLQTAGNNGIFANAKFILPSEFIWSLYRLKNKDVPKHLPSDRTAVQWTLFRLLQEKPALIDLIPAFPSGSVENKTLFQFCGQLADVFDQYQVYRPEMTEKWLRNEYSTNLPAEQWQAEIWRILDQEWKGSEITQDLPRRAEIFADLKKWLQNGQLTDQLPENLCFFGLTQHSAPFLEIITAIAANTDVHFFSSAFPSFDEPLNSLAERWAKPKSEQLNLLQILLEEENVEVVSQSEKDPVKLPDIKVHSCHNMRREVEVLKNRILHFLDHHPDKNVQDILIMVPDMQSYAGLVETIFSRGDSEPEIPVSGISFRWKHSVTQTLLELMGLFKSAFKTNDVLQTLSSESVRAGFNLSESDLNLIEKWVYDNSIFWGLGERPDSLYSWSRGVNQLMAGFAMEAEPLEMYNYLIPYAGVISSEQLECAAKLSTFIHALKKAEEKVHSNKTPHQWFSFLRDLVNNFIPDDRQHIVQKTQMLKNLATLDEQIELSGFQNSIPFELFKSWISSQLDSVSSASGRFGHGITLSTYIPYRSVPFSFIAVLGLNEGAFPRQSVRPAYDLLYKNPATGDRILKEDDTQIFLETITAAGEYLHLSFEGREPKSNNKKLPSVLVQQLMEVVSDDVDKLLQENSLHSFNKINFQSGNSSYSAEEAELGRKLYQGKFNSWPFISSEFIYNPAEEAKTISIGDFISFFTNPSRYFIKNILDAGSYSDLRVLNDRELFSLNALDKYKLDQELFAHLQKESDEKQVLKYLSGLAAIPEGYAGEKVLNTAKDNISELLDALKKIKEEEQNSVEIQISINDVDFAGNIENVCGDRFISYRAGKMKGKYLAEHFIKHLFLFQADTAVEKSYFLCKGEKEGIGIFEFQSKDLRSKVLEDYVTWYLQLENWPVKLNFFPNSSMAYAKSLYEGDEPAKAIKKAQDKWLNYRNFGDATDTYVQFVWANQEPLLKDAFRVNALRFWKPVLDAMKTVEEGEV